LGLNRFVQMSRFCFQFSLLLFFAIKAFSQSPASDSLLGKALTAPMDSTRVLLLNDAATSLREGDNNRALQFAEEARDLATKLQYKKGLAKVQANLGWMYYRQGKYAKSLKVSSEALLMNQKIGDKKEIANCLINIGAVNVEKKLYDVAIANYKTAYQIGVELNVIAIKSRSLNNISFAFLRNNQLDSARHYALRAIDENINDDFRTAFSKRTLGDIFFEQRKYKAALENWQDCFKSSIQSNNNFLIASTLVRLGKIHAKLNKTDQALYYLNQSLEIAKMYNYKRELEDAFKLLAEIYAIKKDFEKAYEFKNQYLILHDSLGEQRNGEQMALAQSQFESDIKNAQIELLTKNGLLKENELRLQRTWMYVGVGGLVLLLALVLVLTRSNRRSQAINRMLAEKNVFINEQAQQLAALNSTKDKLFSILGHDLRSPLNSLRGMMDLLNKSILTQDEFVEFSKKIKTNVDYVYADLDNLLSWAQSQQKGLKSAIEELGLYDVIIEKVQLLAESSSVKAITIHVEVNQDLRVRADKNQLGLIVRNLVSNAIKFSNEGGVVIIRAIKKKDQVEISVTDKGVGIDVADTEKLFRVGVNFSKPGTRNEKGIGLGLLLVKEFVELNKGTIRVTSKLGEGSTFTFSLPAKA
jgi:two-component system sensor histidine kinase/response regulator